MFDADGINSGTITEESTATVKELSTVFGVTTRRIRQLAEDDIVVRAERGKYLLSESVQRYAAFMAKPESNEEEIKMEMDRRKAELMLKQAKATSAMLLAKELEGKMHRSEDVNLWCQGLIEMIKNALLSMPGQIAVELSLQETAEDCQIILKSAVKDVLREISEFDYDPVFYERLVRERLNMQEVNEDDE